MFHVSNGLLLSTTGHCNFQSRVRKWRNVRALRIRSEIDAQLKSHLLFICGFGERILLRRHSSAYIVPTVALWSTVTGASLYATVTNNSFNKYAPRIY
jgi:hypothetical protein